MAKFKEGAPMTEFKEDMNVAAAGVMAVARAATTAGLSNEATALALVIGALSYIRAHGLPESMIMSEARKATPCRLPGDGVSFMELR